MEQKQIILLTALAKKLKSKKKNKVEVVESLKAARIFSKGGNFTGHYSSLKRVVSE